MYDTIEHKRSSKSKVKKNIPKIPAKYGIRSETSLFLMPLTEYGAFDGKNP